MKGMYRFYCKKCGTEEYVATKKAQKNLQQMCKESKRCPMLAAEMVMDKNGKKYPIWRRRSLHDKIMAEREAEAKQMAKELEEAMKEAPTDISTVAKNTIKHVAGKEAKIIDESPR